MTGSETITMNPKTIITNIMNVTSNICTINGVAPIKAEDSILASDKAI